MNNTIAILWVLLSTALFTVIYAAAKLADGTVGTFQILFLRYIGSLAMVLVLVHRNGGLSAHRSVMPGQHFARAALGCFAAAAIVWASARMPLVDATAIGMLFGVFSFLAGVVFLRERVTWQHFGAVFIAAIGAGVVAAGQGAFQSGLVLIPMLVALLSAVLMTGEGILIRTLSQTDTALTLMLYVSGFGILLMFPLAVWTWQPVGPGVVALCVGLGPLASFAQYCTIRGYRIAPLSVVGPVDYSWLIFAGLLGWAVFGEIPGLHILWGGGLIVAGGVLLMRMRG